MVPNRVLNRRPNVLYLVHRVPYPPNRGDRIRSWHTLRALAQRADVWLACTADDAVDASSKSVLAELTCDLHIAPLPRFRRWSNGVLSLAGGRTATEGLFASESMVSVVRRWARDVDFDAVLVFCSSMAQFAEVPELVGVPLFVDLVDVDSEKWLELATRSRFPKSLLYGLEGRRLRRLEVALGRRARAVTLVSEAEADLYREFAPDAHAVAVPNGVDTEFFRPDTSLPEEDRRDCVFIGVLDYPPNVEGVVWFADHIWPRVHEKHPESRFVVVGLRPVNSIRRLADRPGIEVAANVPDVRPYLCQAAVAVAPLRLARGVQNKVLEAMSCGRPVVATPAALTGLDADRGTDVIEAESVVDWITSLNNLLASAARRTQLGTSARNYVEAHHDWNTCLAPLAELLQPAATEVDPAPAMEMAAR